MRQWPPRLGDNDLAMFETRRKSLEYRFGSDKQIVTHNFFPEIDYTETPIKKLFCLDIQRKNFKKTYKPKEILQKVDALAYLRSQKLKNDANS